MIFAEMKSQSETLRQFFPSGVKCAAGDVGITSAAADRAWDLVRKLRTGNIAVWNPILSKALPAAAVGAGAGYLGHRLLSDPGKTWDEQEKRRRRSLQWSLAMGGLAGFGAANTTWKHSVNPLAGRGLLASVFTPISSTAKGLAENSQKNQTWVADTTHRNAILPKRILDNALDATRYPVVGNWKMWLPAMLDPTSEARGVASHRLPKVDETAYRDYLSRKMS